MSAGPAAVRQNTEAERSVLGAMMTYEPAVEQVLGDEGLRAADHYYDRHRLIHAAIEDLRAASKPVDELAVIDRLTERGDIEAAGGANEVSRIAAEVPAPGNAGHHAAIVKKEARMREAGTLADKLGAAARAGTLNGEVDTLLDQFRTISPSGDLELVKGSDITLRKVDFLDAAHMIPKSSVTVIVGPAGLGKTGYGLGIGAAASTGRLEGLDGPRNVLISSQEDDAEAVILPRLKAAGGDLSRVFIVNGLTIPAQVEALRREAKRHEAAMVLIDPIGAHLDGNVDSHKEAAVRGAIRPLADMASELKLAVLVVAHPNKATSLSGLNRISGSGGLGNAARSVIVFGTDPADPDGENGDRRIIAHLKSNVGKRAPSLTAEIETTGVETEDGIATVPRLRITGQSDQGAEDILSSPSPEERTERDEAREFLRELLANGPVRSKEIERVHCQNAGLSFRTVRRAKADLQVRAEQKADGWYWQLPEAA